MTLLILAFAVVPLWCRRVLRVLLRRRAITLTHFVRYAMQGLRPYVPYGHYPM